MEVEININTPIRQHLSPDGLWRGDDKGIIKAWELGREWAERYPEMSELANAGILLEMKRKTGDTINGKPSYIRLFKGGFDKKQKEIFRFGSLHYYAMWLGLRGDNLILDLEKEYPLVCSETNMGVVYTLDSKKYLTTKINSNELHKYGSAFISKVSG